MGMSIYFHLMLWVVLPVSIYATLWAYDRSR